MAALALKNAFNREKPHSSVTDWVDILTADSVADEAYDGIPELVDAINLQGAGPAEASRAIRKKLKHGHPHQQYRALVILKALVENCGHKFQTTFADGQLTDALKHLANDSYTDKKVKKKLLLVLASWHDQFKSDPSMSIVAGLYKQSKHSQQSQNLNNMGLPDMEAVDREAKRKAAKLEKEQAKEKARLAELERRRLEKEREKERKNRPKRAPFDFEKEKPMVLASIVDASQASSNLVNAITLVNQEKDSLLTNPRVQECLAKAKQARKPVVRYIQLVENEELIGTLIETNDRIIHALEMYDKMSAPTAEPEDETGGVTTGLAAVNISETEVNKLQEKQRMAVARAKNSYRGKSSSKDEDVHPDLHDLSFGVLGSSSQNLPAPLRPSTLSDEDDGYAAGEAYASRGSLSDFSDYDSSDEDTHNAAGPSSGRGTRDYATISDDEAASGFRRAKFDSPAASKGALVDVDDPFADPFAD